MAVKVGKKAKKSLRIIYLIIILALIFVGFIIFRKIQSVRKEVVIKEKFDVTEGLEKISVKEAEVVLKNPAFSNFRSYVPKLIIPPGILGKENPFK